MEEAEVSEKQVDKESQLHPHALESPFLVSCLEAFYQVPWKGMGWGVGQDRREWGKKKKKA